MRTRNLALCLLVLLAASAIVTHAQNQPTPPKAEAAEKPARKKPRGRLPNYYRKAGVSQKQTETIYAIQAKYKDRIANLQEQIDALVAERDAEVEAVLTDEQKKRVEQLREEAAKKREERRKEKAAESATDSDSDS
jgi:hypothetical protein